MNYRLYYSESEVNNNFILNKYLYYLLIFIYLLDN